MVLFLFFSLKFIGYISGGKRGGGARGILLCSESSRSVPHPSAVERAGRFPPIVSEAMSVYN